MKGVPVSIIQAAQNGEIEAVQFIFSHFEGYIAKKCLRSYTDENGTNKTYVDDDLRYKAETALLDAIFSFQFRDPPDSFTG